MYLSIPFLDSLFQIVPCLSRYTVIYRAVLDGNPFMLRFGIMLPVYQVSDYGNQKHEGKYDSYTFHHLGTPSIE